MTVSGGTQPNDIVEVLTPDSDNYYEIPDSDVSIITFYGTSNGVIKVIESVTGTFVVYNEDKRNFKSTVTLPAGTYTFECWGGQGNNATCPSRESGAITTLTANGGYGGYVKGCITFNEQTTIFIHVGTGGGTHDYGSGAGVPVMNKINNISCVTLSTIEDWNNVLICAGGGGYPTMIRGYYSPNVHSLHNGNDATKTIPSPAPSESLKLTGETGGIDIHGDNRYWYGHGGDGYYGGVAGKGTSSGSSREGAGGCNYIKNIMTDTVNKSGSEYFSSPAGVEEKGHHGSACVRITGTAYQTRTYEIFSAQSRDDINTPYTVDLNPDFIGDSTFTRKVHVNETINESTRRLQNLTNMCSHKPNSNVLSYINQAQQCNYKFTTGKHYLDSNIDKYGDVYFKDSGNWITSKKGTYIKRNGDWAKSKSVYVKENGFWKTMMPNSVTINFSLDGETIEPIVSYMGCTIIPPNNGGAITWRDDDDNDVTNGYRIDSAVDSITLYGSVE